MSSANNIGVLLLQCMVMSLRYKRNKRGPRIEPWGLRNPKVGKGKLNGPKGNRKLPNTKNGTKNSQKEKLSTCLQGVDPDIPTGQSPFISQHSFNSGDNENQEYIPINIEDFLSPR